MTKSNSKSDFDGSIIDDEDKEVDADLSAPLSTSHPATQIERLAPRKTLGIEIPPSPCPESTPVTPKKSKHSSLADSSRMHTDMNDDPTGSMLRGAALFRATARKVLRLCQASFVLGALNGVGGEPGIDPRRASAAASYGHIKETCAIEVVDYSSLRSKTQSFNNQEFVDFLKNSTKCESWAKVRWISVGGISWDVISMLALQYNLHPLSLEDVLHRRNHVRSKADYFARHLFLRVLCHSLGDPDEHKTAVIKPDTTRITTLPRSSSPKGYESGAVGTASDIPEAQAGSQVKIADLKGGDRVDVQLQDLFLFLLRDGTIITIHQTPSFEFPQPILSRLRGHHSVLRKTADPSLLVQSLLDLVVDQAMQVVEEYQKKILKFERDILLKPNMESVRNLHVLSGYLTLHKRTLGPLKSLVYGLRRYDLDRCKAVGASVTGDSAEVGATSDKVVGYMSHTTKVYLADVLDHVDYILTSLDMFASVTENLIDYTFNMASYEMTEIMRRLTLTTIIFLPLILLSGYFGMNFKPRMWSVEKNSDVLYWKIAIPLVMVVITLFTWSDIVRAKHFAQKKIALKQYAYVVHR